MPLNICDCHYAVYHYLCVLYRVFAYRQLLDGQIEEAKDPVARHRSSWHGMPINVHGDTRVYTLYGPFSSAACP